MKETLYILLFTQLFSCTFDTKEKATNTIQKPAKIEEKANEYKFVNTQSGLNYRNKPKGKIIGKFEDSQKLQIIKHTTVFETIKDGTETKKGEWLGVKKDKDTVYVFGAYLSTTIKTKILIPTTYRDWDNKNPANSLNKSWFDLYKKESKYYLGKANYHIEKGEDPCTGIFTKTIHSANNTLIFIKNTQLKSGVVHAIDFSKNKIWPNEKITFKYKNTTYTIRAEGDVISTEGEGLERYSVVENYKLYIATNNSSESMFLEESSFNNSFVKLLFVGDIDADGKLDFIFKANRDYEEERVILYLSSEAKKGETIKKASEIAIQFDC